MVITESLQDSVSGSSPDSSTRKCSRCKKTFVPSSRHKSCPPCRYVVKKRPCPECGIRETQYERCISCANKARTGTGNSRTLTSSGYIEITVEGKNVLEHRHLMSVHLGRPLLRSENVHHINGVRDDNRLENLELWNTYQPSGQRAEDKVAWAVEILRLYAPNKLNGDLV